MKRRSAVALAVALALSAGMAAESLVPSWAASYTLGLDVSHYQGSINWRKVARSRHVFVYQKATEGTSYSDPTYARNRSAAAANGITFGAYHFSNPTGSTRAAAVAEARREATHFVDVARPAAGDLIPALDLENSQYTQAMPTKRLINWVDAWLQQVESTVGVKPDIYTSPYFWRTKLNDTTHFANEGYRLWLAHWTSAAQPSVPARDWSGNHWTFWQWTDCAQVPGIQGCVDEDRYSGSDLTPVVIPGGIPSPTPTPTPSVTILKPTNTAAPAISGDASVGSTLSATSGTWDGSQPMSYTYAWYRCDQSGGNCAGITGGTEPTYQLAPDDYGHTMIVKVTATNEGGSATASSSPSTVVVDTTPPTAPSLTRLARVTAANEVALAWSDAEAGISSFDVRRRSAPFDADFGPYDVIDDHASGTSSTVPVAAGQTHCFSVRARDEADNVSEWSAEACTTAPVDDRALLRAGRWRSSSDPDAYEGTLSMDKQRGAALTLRGMRADRVTLAVERCPGCGRVRVEVNGRGVKDVRLGQVATSKPSLVPIGPFPHTIHGRLRLIVLSSGKPVKIDGAAVVRDPR